MPTGTGAETLSHVPSQPFVVDPAAFFQMTRRNVITARSGPAPAPGGFTNHQLLQTGIVSKLLVTYRGTLTITAPAAGVTPATTSDLWPYGVLGGLTLSANGQTDLISVGGVDLHALRFARYPAYREFVDQFPGTVGGGDALAAGTYPVHLTWEVPIAIDDTTLIGAIYAQSSATNLTLRTAMATMAELFTASPGLAAFSNGTIDVQEILFEVPYDGGGNLLIPDLSRLHGINGVDVPFQSVGEQRAQLVRSQGQLSRLFVSVRASAANRLSALPNAASTKKLEALRVEYGGNQRPYVFEPAATLLSYNGQHYGAPVPYDRLVLDLVKENPPRDVFLMQGLTELAVVPRVGAGVTVTGGAVRLVQETLF